MTAVTDFLVRARTVLTSAVTWLFAAATVVNVVVAELAPYADVRYVGDVIRWGTAAATVLAAAAAVVRRVVDVSDTELVGLKPVDTVVLDVPNLDAALDDEFWTTLRDG